MSASLVAARAGARRGWIELKHMFTTPGDLVPLVIWTAALLGVMIWTRTTTVPGTRFSLGTTMLASAIGMNVGFNGLATLGGLLVVEREDGTLLRAKATPHGMTGYLVGKVVMVSGSILISVAVTLIAGGFLFSGLTVGSAATWLTLLPVLVLGLVATLPIGAVLGSLIPSARSTGLLTHRARRADRDVRHLLPDHSPAALAAVGRAGVPALLAGPRDALGAAPGHHGLGGDRSFVASPGHVRRARGVGRHRPPGGPGRAAADGAARVRGERSRPPREGHAAGRVRRRHE